VAVVRELVDVMYTPRDPPYVAHAEGLRLHTSYVEKFWAASLSMCAWLTCTRALFTRCAHAHALRTRF
jgi:hypothetical protein